MNDFPDVVARGIRDMEQKMADLRAVAGVSTDVELLKAILAKKQEAYSMRTAMYKWNRSKDPSKGHQGKEFRQSLYNHLVAQGLSVDGETFWASFLRESSLEFRALLIATGANLRSPAYTTQKPYQDKWVPIYYSDEANVDDVQAAILNGRLDQKLHYKSPDAIETWKKLINDQRYEQYDHCTEALAKFCNSSEWREFVKNGIEGVVTLGAGSPSKDLQIIRVLRDQANGQRKIAHIVVDASPYMIEETRAVINRAILSDNSIQQHVAIRYCVGDFLKFQDTPIRRKSGGNVAWFILGGTFGNINETAFLSPSQGKPKKAIF